MRLQFRLAIVALALAPLGAPLLAASHPMAALLIRSFFSRLCHQIPARSFIVEGSPVAVCVRCLGIYCGAALATLAAFFRRRKVLEAHLLIAVALALLLNLLDVVAGWMHWYGNLPVPRFFLGLLLGVGAGALLSLPRDRFAERFSSDT
jgi:uncharacterized membrane protein